MRIVDLMCLSAFEAGRFAVSSAREFGHSNQAAFFLASNVILFDKPEIKARDASTPT
jgi:hypothetical protein